MKYLIDKQLLRPQVRSSSVTIDTSGFVRNLSVTDTDVLTALATLDNPTNWGLSGDLTVDGDAEVTGGTLTMNSVQTLYNPGALGTFTGSLFVGNGGASLSHSTGSEGYYNLGMGVSALMAIQDGFSNTAMGHNALAANQSGNHNVAVGQGALAAMTASYATAVGMGALAYSTGGFSTAVGRYAGYDEVGGYSNVYVGYNTGRGIVSGHHNTIIGAQVTGLSSSLSNHIILADGAGNKRIVSDGSGNIGLGIFAPTENLHLYGAGPMTGLVEFTTASSYSEWSVTSPTPKLAYLRLHGASATGTFFGVTKANLAVLQSDATNFALGTTGAYPLLFGTNDTLSATIDGSTQKWTFAQQPTFSAGLLADTIDEVTSDTGVTVDGMLIKDGRIVRNYATANGVTLTAGTSSETVTDLQTLLDGNVYNVTEATGAPGINLEVDFTGITMFHLLIFRAYYVGLTTHAVRVQLYNYDTTAWDTFHTLESGMDISMVSIEIPDDTNYIDSGAAIVRFYHTESGNVSHNLYVDYVTLGS